MALDLYFAGVKRRVQDDVANDIESKRNIIFKNPRVIGRHLARRIGIDIATHILDRLGNIQRRPSLGSLKRHVLEEMRDAVLLKPFMSPTGRHPHAQRRRRQTRHMFCDDAHAVCQTMKFYSHFARIFRIKPSISPRSFATRVTRSGR